MSRQRLCVGIDTLICIRFILQGAQAPSSKASGRGSKGRRGGFSGTAGGGGGTTPLRSNNPLKQLGRLVGIGGSGPAPDAARAETLSMLQVGFWKHGGSM